MALGRHNTRADVVAFLEDLTKEGCLEGPVGMVLYEWRDGQLGPACAQGGPKGEGGLDDATGGSGMAGGAGLKQTSATLDLVRRVFFFFFPSFFSSSSKGNTNESSLSLAFLLLLSSIPKNSPSQGNIERGNEGDEWNMKLGSKSKAK